MQIQLNKKEAFTLIELMIVVVIIGILAAAAIPSFNQYIQRSKTAEAPGNLSTVFKGEAVYYSREKLTTRSYGTANGSNNYCVIASDENMHITPGRNKQMYDYGQSDSFSVLGIGFLTADPAYYNYTLTSEGAVCDNSANDASVYSNRALGDLDGDGSLSTFEMNVGSDAQNALGHMPLYIIDELE